MTVPPDDKPTAQRIQRALDAIARVVGSEFGCDAVTVLALHEGSAIGAAILSTGLMETHGVDEANRILVDAIKQLIAELVRNPIQGSPIS